MSTSMSEITYIKEYLEQQFIVISSEWVEACISFVKTEHNQTLSLQNLKNFVYQQWLNADLEEIGACTFGVNCELLATSHKTTLKGCYALQVDGIRDVGRPAYSQLKELEQVVNSNAEFSAAPQPAQPSWEAKPTRMLMLNLTDGCSHIQGMEYKPINALSPNLVPGIKVLIQGPVDCRFGVLLLTPEKIKVLGGEVEEKLTQFSRRAILRQILQLPLEDETDDSSNINITSLDANGQISQTSGANETNNSSQMNALNTGQHNAIGSRNPNTRNVSNVNTFTSNNRRQNMGRETATASSMRQQHASRNQQNTFTASSREQNYTRISAGGVDEFETEDDDFDLSLDHGVLDELERESLNKSQSSETAVPEEDVWLADEDVIEDMMAFQDEHPGFEMPFFPDEEIQSSHTKEVQNEKPFVYLSFVLKDPSPDCTVTIKGFIITVLSKLECTLDKGWNLMVKINDGTATLDVSIHDKVLEGIIGISAPTMVKMQVQAANNPEKRKEVMEAISRCKVTLQDYNCLMDVKFTPGSKPCLVKCYPISHVDVEQLLERVRSKF